MSTKIKICGLRRIEDVDYVNEAQPDYAGVILCRRFWRGIDFEQAKLLHDRLDPNIPLVGVFVNDKFSDVLMALRTGVVDMVQLHGTESEEYISSLRMLNKGVEIVKAVRVHSPDVIRYAVNSRADHILLDSATQERKGFDWNLAKDIKRNYILAGGLTPETIPQAIQQLHPWGVDLCGGVEDVIGPNPCDRIKSREKIIAAVQAAHRNG